MGLLTPAWKSKNIDKALRAVAKLSNQDKLEKVADEAADYRVRKAAVEKLTKQSVLIHKVDDNDADVRMAAVKRITGQDSLAVIALSNHDEKVAQVAFSLITDDQIFIRVFMFALTRGADAVAVRAFDRALMYYREIDDKMLELILENAKSGNVQRAALQSIKDPVLFSKALKANKKIITSVFVERISDPHILMEIAMDCSGLTASTAVSKIKEQEILKTIVCKAFSPESIRTALAGIHDQSLLKEIVLNTKGGHRDIDIEARKGAVSRITDQKILQEIVLRTTHADCRKIAFNGIIDPDIQLALALELRDSAILSIVFARITDPDKLKEYALQNIYPAVSHIKDLQVLKEIAVTTSNCHLRGLAMGKITDPSVIRELETEYGISKDGHKWKGCECAVCHITNHQPGTDCKCTQCGETVHNFGPYEQTGIAAFRRVCKRCGEVKTGK